MQSLIENVYVRCVLLSLIGWLLNLLKNLNSARKDSIIANLEFSYGKYFDMEKIALMINGVAQGMVMVYIPDILKYTGKEWAATLLIGVCAFFGSEFITLIFGTARVLIKKAIDNKTTELDTHKGTLDQPTPLK